MYKIIVLFLSVILYSSCSDKYGLDGKWEDNIKLSTKKVEFGVEADSVIITTKGDWWWIDGISLNDSNYVYYNNEDINLESDHYKIVEDDFVVERRDKNTLFVKMNKNLTGNQRVMTIVFEAGDYFDRVNIIQSAD